jgi:glycyl-tRNA synthetase beta chain
MSEDAEKALYDFAIDFEAVSKQELENKNFEKYLKEILKGKKVINEFFDNIMVMDKDEAIRNNRLSLLKKLDILFKQVADITELD